VGLPALTYTGGTGFRAQGAPKDIIAKLNAVVVEAVRASGAVTIRRSGAGLPARQQTPETLAALQKPTPKWWPIIRARPQGGVSCGGREHSATTLWNDPDFPHPGGRGAQAVGL
jgi:hypothetical protein